MRRFFLLVLVCSVLLFFKEQVLAAEYSYVRTSVIGLDEDVLTKVNGETVELDARAYIKSGRTMVPLRFLEYALGAEVTWEPKTRTVILQLKDKEIKVTVDRKLAYIDGKTIELDVAAELKTNRVFVPVRFIGENMRARVTYVGHAVSLVYIDKTGWKDFADPSVGMRFKYPNDWKVIDTVYSGVQFTTPNGCNLKLTKERGTYSEVVKAKRETLIKVGSEKPYEEAVSGPLYKGVQFTYEKDPVKQCYTKIFVVRDSVYSWEYEGEDRIDTGYFDLPLYEELWLSMQED